MTTVKKREEMDPQYQWKLEDIFATEKAWDEEFEKAKSMLPQFQAYQGKLNNAQDIFECFKLDDQLSMHLERLYVYANMRLHQNMANTKYQALAEKARKLNVEANEALSFINPEILALSNEKLDQLIADPQLAEYKHSLEEMKRSKAHILSQAEEAIMAQVGNISSASSNIFGMLNNADMKFPKVKNERGEEVELTHGTYIQFLESKNRDVRREAFGAMYRTYSSLKNTLGATFSANINKNLFMTKVRKYNSALEMYLYGDNVPTSVYNNLIETIHEHLPLMYRYMELRKKLLGIEELHMYDLFAPLVEEFDMNISYDKAQDIIAESLKPLGNDYLSVLQQGFKDGWIDVYENEGKRSGAYSWGAYGTHPYVLLNHKDNLNSMFTLTHEMGHALHSYYSDEAQTYRNAQYPIFLAEVASTLNEALLMDHLLKNSTDPKEKLYLLTYYADQFRTTVFRQTMFAEFEKIVHERSEQGESLTPEEYSAIYYDLNKLYYGDGVVVDEDIAMEWARIPHFYTSFYVYKYATGFSAATSFSKQILEEGAPAVERYLGFLKSGGSDYPIEILKRAGVDMSSPEPIEQAMSVFKELIEQMEELVK
ncbi:oligoendopeptidase F [Paenibacillus montaniterrae]|uniref:Oligopeptidase F n=1 Tax=Paenibacillus montaniterrae TaxID=429341 RepID=A0A919YNL1_9BACL|nr:oligoendopeptidase F [Paenibacillus montaniterrae]GIP15406.1 oligoendopeptidase F [Paenibacillus montaniterrae]